jgi:hypothetical protein
MGRTDDFWRKNVWTDVNAATAADVDVAVAASSGLRLMGYSIRESAGSEAVATCRIMRGATAAGGTVLVNIELAASTSETVWFGPHGLEAETGLSIDRIAGTFDITLYYMNV